MDKLKKNSKVKETQILSKSKFFTNKDMITTDVPMINVALSGDIDGGLTPGLTVLAGPSKHFKTSFNQAQHAQEGLLVILAIGAGLQQRWLQIAPQWIGAVHKVRTS